MPYLGYEFCFKIGSELIILPITPEKLEMKFGSNNKVVTLINGGDVNILKSPSLAEFEFDARFPMRHYPYARNALNFEAYLTKFNELKSKKKSFTFSVIRKTPDGKQGTWGTSRVVSLEDLVIKESADEGDDVIVTFKLKEYKNYGVNTVKVKTATTVGATSLLVGANRPTTNKDSLPTTYTVKPGDCLWKIAKKFYNNGAKWKTIYNANKTVIEKTANKYRNGKGSNNGWSIYPGTKLTIPAV